MYPPRAKFRTYPRTIQSILFPTSPIATPRSPFLPGVSLTSRFAISFVVPAPSFLPTSNRLNHLADCFNHESGLVKLNPVTALGSNDVFPPGGEMRQVLVFPHPGRTGIPRQNHTHRNAT